MNLHEYQAKQLLKNYGLTVPNGVVASVTDLNAVIAAMKQGRWVVKAQVHAGGRGKAGGVKLVNSKEEAQAFALTLLGTRLITYQTTAQGQPINQVLFEEPSDIARELYLGAVVDRASRRITFMASTEGGVEIEKVAHEHPEKILTTVVEPLVGGVLPYQGRQLGFALGLVDTQIKQFTHLLMGLGKMFVENDLSLLEINPLVITKQGQVLCLDGKINIDDNALYRQPALQAMRDATQEDERENRARAWDLNYIALEGNIGCMVNGAGLAMATMDLVKLHGGSPANFLDVGGGATKERVTEAFKIILSDQKVKAILVNIFGGIVRCDLIADGIIGAVSEVGTALPVVVRLEGNNADLGAQKLANSGLNIIAAHGFDDAAQKVVTAVGI